MFFLALPLPNRPRLLPFVNEGVVHLDTYGSFELDGHGSVGSFREKAGSFGAAVDVETRDRRLGSAILKHKHRISFLK